MQPVRHLYVHIPFCGKICPYCSFYKSPAAMGGFREFVQAVLAEARRHRGALRPETIFFGGGTPTALSTSHLEELIAGLAGIADFSALVEFTVEMNPATVSPGKARALLALGVTRASMGVQSWDTAHLATLGRSHSPSAAQRSYEILRDAGFTNINLDLMFGVPGQSLESWQHTLDATIALNPDHISAYSLTWEEDTEFFLRLARGHFSTDAALDAAMFEETERRLGTAGFHAYETSNFARPGFNCRHNLAYWRGADFLGLGPSAVSTMHGQRFTNLADTAAYIARLSTGDPPTASVEQLTPEHLRLERLALGLRTSAGVPSLDLAPHLTKTLLHNGLAIEQEGRIVLTTRGRPLADAIAAEAA